VSTGCLQIDYYGYPADMDSDDDIPFDSDYSLYEFHQLIAEGVAVMCLKDEGSGSYSTLKGEYYQNLLDMKHSLNFQPDLSGSIEIDMGGK
jgi:hypothetical protein